MKTVIATLLLILSIFSTSAQIIDISNPVAIRNKKTCISSTMKKAGTVLPIAPANIHSKEIYYNSAVLILKKTGGTAKATATIYVNGIQTAKVEFANGRQTPTENVRLNNVFGKKVRVHIKNRSVAKKFKYKTELQVQSNSIMPLHKTYTHTLREQSEKRITFNKPCTGKGTIEVRRKIGKAPAQLRLFAGNNVVYETILEPNQSIKKIMIDSYLNRLTKHTQLGLSIRNIDIHKKIKFSVDAWIN